MCFCVDYFCSRSIDKFPRTSYFYRIFIVLDIDCNPTCPINLGRPFLRTIGAIIDMKEGNIIFQFP